MARPLRPRRTSLFAGLALFACSCLAPPPPIVVETPFGDVRADSQAQADRVANLLTELSPRLRRILPGCQDRTIDVWVQNELRVYRNQRRPESVRGFTLLRDEFEARRIHLQDQGQSSWYLAHELVHALIGPSWKALPGILEEGLGDVVAEALNPDFDNHIRAHRLLNAASLSGGFDLTVTYAEPTPDTHPWRWPRREQTLRVEAFDPAGEPTDAIELLEASRSELHRKWPEIPESLYGFNFQSLAPLTGPGYFVAVQDGGRADPHARHTRRRPVAQFEVERCGVAEPALGLQAQHAEDAGPAGAGRSGDCGDRGGRSRGRSRRGRGRSSVDGGSRRSSPPVASGRERTGRGRSAARPN